jgi:ABC-type antimicrobial peptide transport system, ATPase component
MSESVHSMNNSGDKPLAVRCKGVTKTYGQGQSAVRALRGVDVEVRTGELLMLVGPSGCGKTTLISVIAGVLDRDEGDARCWGRTSRNSGGPARRSFGPRTLVSCSRRST